MKSLAYSLFAVLVTFAIGYSLFLVFLVVPNEEVMGAVQRIFYFHVSSAFATYIALGAVLLGAAGYLFTEKPSFDALQEGAAEISLVFASILFFTGMIWGNSAWGTPFTFEPRLVSSLIMWLILIGLNLLRWYGDSSRLSTHCSILGILSSLTVPLVVYSIKFLPQFQQLHPQVVEKGGLTDPSMKLAFLITSLSVMGLCIVLIWIRTRIGILERLTRAQRDEVFL
ncbi:MAG: cytochrome c biogenesis protein CcsA [Bdellovibrionales bacterium]|nr:cytochrome c biogenesis protein CcsA [Bdellovibrionales bacterium]